MIQLFNDIENAIATNETLICLLQGRAGSGKVILQSTLLHMFDHEAYM